MNFNIVHVYIFKTLTRRYSKYQTELNNIANQTPHFKIIHWTKRFHNTVLVFSVLLLCSVFHTVIHSDPVKEAPWSDKSFFKIPTNKLN